MKQRLLIWGRLYQQILLIQKEVPQNGTIWWVSPLYPWLINYFLYPRLLRWGSPNLAELAVIRRAHPQDWVLTDTPELNQEHLHLYPPLS